MLSWVIYVKTKLIFVGEIFIYEIFTQKIIPNTLKHFGRNWLVVFSIFFITFFKNWNHFCNYRFCRKDCFFKKCLKSFEENNPYRIVDLHNNVTVKTIPTNGFVLFERLKCFFFRILEEKVFLVTIGNLLTRAMPTLVKYLLNSFAISFSFLVIPCLVLQLLIDFFFYFPEISFITSCLLSIPVAFI